MCGRITQTSSIREYAELFGVRGPLPNTRPRYNLAPTQEAVVCRLNPDTGERSLDLLHFGLVPHFMRDKKRQSSMINAKAETVEKLPSYRAAFKKRRGLVPANHFYEWRAEGKVKQPLAIRNQNGDPMALACIWENWHDAEYNVWYRSFSIITTTANELMASIHDRMPVILDCEDWPVWLGEQDGDPASLLRPYDADRMEAYPVSRDVGNVRNDEAWLIERAA